MRFCGLTIFLFLITDQLSLLLMYTIFADDAEAQPAQRSTVY